MGRYRFVLWLMLILFCPWACWAQPDEELGVCQVLESLSTFSGKTVTIEGMLVGNEMHGYYLRDLTKQVCRSKRKLFLRSTVKLFDSQDSEVYSPKRKFVTDRTAFRTILRNARRTWATDATVDFRIVVVGELVSRKDVFVICDSPDVCWGNGYGPGGACAAALVVRTLEVKQTSAPAKPSR